MPQTYPHGGHCCGMTHLFRFGSANDFQCVGRTKELVRQTKRNGRCIEVVLTDRQIQRSPTVAAKLKGLGFELVSRFFNSNSGNYCNVLHLTRDKEDQSVLRDRSPFHAITAIVEKGPDSTRTVRNQRLNGVKGRDAYVILDDGDDNGCFHAYPIGAYVKPSWGTRHDGVVNCRLTEPSLGEYMSQWIPVDSLRPYRSR